MQINTMRWADIAQTGVIINNEIGTPHNAESLYWAEQQAFISAGGLIQPVIVAVDPPAKFDTPYTSVPVSVTMRQARLALLHAGYLPAIDNFIATASEEIKISWGYAGELHRGSDMVNRVAASLDITPAQLDQLFITAKTL